MSASAPAILEIGLILLLAVASGSVARRLGAPAVLGYLAAGVVVSPFTPGYVADREHLELLADVGVVLLLFEVGLDINPLRLARTGATYLWAVPVQVAVTTGLVAAACVAAGLGPTAALALGLSVAMSSSVVVVNITRSRRRTTTAATDEALLSWSVVQDITGVAATLILLAAAGLTAGPPLRAAASLLGFLAVAVAAAWLLPRLLRRLREQHDLFLLLSVGSGLALAGVGAEFFGVPLALAAFAGGLAVGESPSAAEARRRIVPFRDLFAVLFFVLLGSLIDPAALPAALPWIGLLLAAVVVAKALPVWALARLALKGVSGLQLSLGLAQVGEFSFVIGSLVLAARLIPPALYTALLGCVVLTIAASTIAVRLPGAAAAPAVE